uniref:Uncharacterized protein n=1 Tax=Plectus sambesii TaxID=2011161 RepID=A0A914V2S2_9BILA
MAQPTVEVLYDFESKTAKGHAINVQAGERYSLIDVNGGDDWCLVGRLSDDTSQFLLPKSYVRGVVERAPDSPVSTFRPTQRHSVTPDMEGRTRQSAMLPPDAIYNVMSSPSSAVSNAQRRIQPSPSRKSPGFKLADPKRISNSIPGDLNFVHNITELAAAQEIDEKLRLRRDDEEERKPLTAVPRMSLAANGLNGIDVDTLKASDSSSGVHRASSFSPSTSPSRRMLDSRLRVPIKPDAHDIVQASTVEPSSHHYQNVQELENAAAERPPAPDVSDEPVRVLNDGWVEYSLNGRPYFFHPHTGLSQWKPPRLMATPAEVAAMLSNSGDELDVSTYSTVDDLQHSQISDRRSISQSPTLMDNYPPPPLEPAPLPPHEISQSPPKESSFATMTDSVDSGLGRTSLSLRNHAYGMRLPGATAMDGNYDAYMCSEDLANFIGSDMGPGSMYARNFSMQNPFQQQKTIKNGLLEKCKTAEAGHKLKKKEWTSCFVFLTSAHMIFYKDEKSAEKFGKHYPAPQGVCDLRGARLSWVDKERDKRRKHVFQLELIDGTSYLFSTVNSQDINGWFHALRQVIAKLPLPDFYPTPAVVLEQEHVRRGSLIGRSSSSLTASSSGLGRLRIDSTGGGAATLAAADKQAKKGKRRSAFVGNGPPPPFDDDPLMAISASGGDAAQSRDTIIERLRRFFRSRPTIESLKEKGIYKPEPVFGSTLLEISQRERGAVPKFVRVVTEVIEAKGLDVDGLYRVSGNLSAIQKIRCQVDQDKYNGLIGEDDVHVLTGALKLFFRELQEPIFPYLMTKDFLNAIRLQNPKQRFKAFEDLLGKMPRCHQETLHMLLKHLARVASHSGQNRMQMHNLAIVFGPTLFSNGAADKPIDKGAKDKSKSTKRSSAGKVAVTAAPPPPSAEAVQSNSHLAFNMIMQGQIVEYLLKEQDKFNLFHS